MRKVLLLVIAVLFLSLPSYGNKLGIKLQLNFSAQRQHQLFETRQLFFSHLNLSRVTQTTIHQPWWKKSRDSQLYPQRLDWLNDAGFHS